MLDVSNSQNKVEWVEIESIKDIGEVDVFDMEIQDNHNFFANGLNVSNCLGGPLAYEMFNDEVISQLSFDQVTPDVVKERIPNILLAMENQVDKLVDVFGEENFFLELQFNKLPSQHALNMCLLELHKKTGLGLITTCDSHYIKGLYKNREMYKQMAWMSRKGYEIKELPESEEDLDCDLYYKNPDQLWECYQDTTKEFDFYDDQVVCESIEKSYDVAHDLIGHASPDRTVKLPSFTFPEGEKPINALVQAAKEGLVNKGLHTDPIYVKRLKRELATVKELNFAEYFLTTKSLIDLAKGSMLVGRGRGCLTKDCQVFMAKEKTFKSIADVRVGDTIIDVNGTEQLVAKTHIYDIDEELVKIQARGLSPLTLTKDHKVFVRNGKSCEGRWVAAGEVKKTDQLFIPKMTLSQNEQKSCVFMTNSKDEFISHRHSNNFCQVSIREISRSTGLKRETVRKSIYDANHNSKDETLEKINKFLLSKNTSISHLRENDQRFKVSKIRNQYKLDDEFLYLCGRWIGDGWIESEKLADGSEEPSRVAWCFNAFDIDGIERIRKTLLSYGFDTVSTNKMNETRCTKVMVRNRKFAKMFSRIFCDYKKSATSKYIPEIFMNHVLCDPLLSGYIDADGSYLGKNKTICISTTASEKLAKQVAWLRVAKSHLANIKTRTNLVLDGYVCNDTYSVAQKMGNEIKRVVDFEEEGTWSKVRKIELIKKAQTKVYDLTIAEPGHPSFLTMGGIVHNSGAGSLLCYCLGITGIDPIKYNLLFERFLNKNRADYPDIDCLSAGTFVQTESHGLLPIEKLEIGMVLPDRNGKPQVVLDKRIRKAEEKETLYNITIESNTSYGQIICSGNHRFFSASGSVVFARELESGSELQGTNGTVVTNVVAFRNPKMTLVDIQVTGDHSFNVVPFSHADEVGGMYDE